MCACVILHGATRGQPREHNWFPCHLLPPTIVFDLVVFVFHSAIHANVKGCWRLLKLALKKNSNNNNSNRLIETSWMRCTAHCRPNGVESLPLVLTGFCASSLVAWVCRHSHIILNSIAPPDCLVVRSLFYGGFKARGLTPFPPARGEWSNCLWCSLC